MKTLLCLFLFFSLSKAYSQTRDSASKMADTLTKALQEIVITGTKRPIDVQADKIILNLDAQPAAIGENILDVLRRSPGVAVDAAENIQLNGKPGVNVMIDGKNTQLSAQDLSQLLKSIEASNVRQIELITNPSAKYDASGNAGIINIKLKKSLSDGFNGNISGSYVQSNHARGNLATNLNWRKDKTAFFFNGAINKGLQYVTANNDRTTNNRIFTQRSMEKDVFHGYSIRAGADYLLNRKSTFGVLWMLNDRNTHMDNASSTILQGYNLTDTIIQTRSITPFNTNRNAFNLNYNYTDGETEFSLDGDYTTYRSSVRNSLTNDLFTQSGTKAGTNATANDQQVVINLYSLKADWLKKFSPSLKVSGGFKMMSTRTTNGLQVQNRISSQWIIDSLKTNHFRYYEDISALYGSLHGNGKKFSWQMGLRAEYTIAKGRSTDVKKTEIVQTDTSYLNLFPTLFLQYKLAGKHQIGLAANRRIDRPNYQDQNPFIYFLDALNTEQGNAYLKPQFTNNIEISYTYNYATSVKISYARTTDYIEQLTYQDGKYTVQIPQNAGTKQMVGLSVSSPVTFHKKWSAYVSLTPYYHYYHVLLTGARNTEMQSGGSWAFNSYMSNTIDLGKGWKANLNGWFNFQNRATIYVSKPLGSLDIGIQKNLLQEKATIKLAIVDLFNTQQWKQTATTNELTLKTYRKWESQNITFSFSWRFGNKKIKKAREREAASEEDAKRIKS